MVVVVHSFKLCIFPSVSALHKIFIYEFNVESLSFYKSWKVFLHPCSASRTWNKM